MNEYHRSITTQKNESESEALTFPSTRTHEEREVGLASISEASLLAAAVLVISHHFRHTTLLLPSPTSITTIPYCTNPSRGHSSNQNRTEFSPISLPFHSILYMMLLLSLLLLSTAMTLPACDAFSSRFVNNNYYYRNKNLHLTTTLYASPSWFSSLNQEPDLWNEETIATAASGTLQVLDKKQRRVATTSTEEEKEDDTQQQAQAQNRAQRLTDRMQMEQSGGVTKRKVRASVKETGYDSMRSYIKTMCNHELLNKNEEVVLAREIQLLIKWEAEREVLEEALLR